jgi:hypothetical protein
MRGTTEVEIQDALVSNEACWFVPQFKFAQNLLVLFVHGQSRPCASITACLIGGIFFTLLAWLSTLGNHKRRPDNANGDTAVERI